MQKLWGLIAVPANETEWPLEEKLPRVRAVWVPTPPRPPACGS
jgi:hypothetical protein